VWRFWAEHPSRDEGKDNINLVEFRVRSALSCVNDCLLLGFHTV
jgi:hypothetical protein